MERGYIKVWRKLEDSGLLQMPNTLALFIFLLMKASRTKRKVGTSLGVVELLPGQYISGRKQLAELLEQGEQQIRTSLNRLESLEILTSTPTNKFTIYTIVNYELYQENNQQVTSTPTNSQPAEQPTNNQQLTTKQELKKKTYTCPPGFDRFWSAYPANRKEAKKSCAEKWVAKNLEALADQIVSHVIAMTPVWGEFNPAPLTYINQERWNDGMPSASKKPRELSL
jgi:hypothetical protein